MKIATSRVTAAVRMIVSLAGSAQAPRFDVASISDASPDKAIRSLLIRAAYAGPGSQMVSQVEEGPDRLGADTALQEQLGLTLETAHSPVDVIVVDHAEPPAGLAVHSPRNAL